MNERQHTVRTELDSRDFFLPDAEQIQELRQIIRSESGHKFTYDETREVAYELIRLYESLAGGKQILPGDFGDGI
jgi:hypothetical protein